MASLTDGRPPGDFASKYSSSAWFQILLELLYLLAVLVGGILLLAWMAKAVVLATPRGFFPELLGEIPTNTPLLVWMAAALAGACGGAASALKWLYHSVAKQQWHRYWVVWRIVVPPLSAVLSVFAGLMIVSGLIPIFQSDALLEFGNRRGLRLLCRNVLRQSTSGAAEVGVQNIRHRR